MVTQSTALINAQLLDPMSDTLKPGGITIKDGLIEKISGDLRRDAPKGATVIDCGGHILAPGLVDMLVYTGVPGKEHRETLATASQAALGWRCHQHGLHAKHGTSD